MSSVRKQNFLILQSQEMTNENTFIKYSLVHLVLPLWPSTYGGGGRGESVVGGQYVTLTTEAAVVIKVVVVVAVVKVVVAVVAVVVVMAERGRAGGRGSRGGVN